MMLQLHNDFVGLRLSRDSTLVRASSTDRSCINSRNVAKLDRSVAQVIQDVRKMMASGSKGGIANGTRYSTF
jgi:hypothetical protein